MRAQERLSLWPGSFAFGCRGRGEVGKILTVTFTKAATEELRGRIRELLVVALASFQGEKNQDEDPTITRLKELESVPVEESIRRLRLAITCFDEAIISTIHGFCQRVLAENSLETNCLFESELDQSSAALVADAVRDYWRANFSEADPSYFSSCFDREDQACQRY